MAAETLFRLEEWSIVRDKLKPKAKPTKEDLGDPAVGNRVYGKSGDRWSTTGVIVETGSGCLVSADGLKFELGEASDLYKAHAAAGGFQATMVGVHGKIKARAEAARLAAEARDAGSVSAAPPKGKVVVAATQAANPRTKAPPAPPPSDFADFVLGSPDLGPSPTTAPVPPAAHAGNGGEAGLQSNLVGMRPVGTTAATPARNRPPLQSFGASPPASGHASPAAAPLPNTGVVFINEAQPAIEARNCSFVNEQGKFCPPRPGCRLHAQLTGHPDPSITPDVVVPTSPILGVQDGYLVTAKGRRYLLLSLNAAYAARYAGVAAKPGAPTSVFDGTVPSAMRLMGRATSTAPASGSHRKITHAPPGTGDSATTPPASGDFEVTGDGLAPLDDGHTSVPAPALPTRPAGTRIKAGPSRPIKHAPQPAAPPSDSADVFGLGGEDDGSGEPYVEEVTVDTRLSARRGAAKKKGKGEKGGGGLLSSVWGILTLRGLRGSRPAKAEVAQEPSADNVDALSVEALSVNE